MEILENARRLSRTECHRQPMQLAPLEYSGGRGRPKISIDPEVLSKLLPARGPTALAPIFHCHKRTIRRRALEAGIVHPGPPVFSKETNELGEEVVVHRSVTRPVSVLTDEELDESVRFYQSQFEAFGRDKMKAAFTAEGHNVPEKHISASLLRVNGVSGVFGNTRPERRKYMNRAPMVCVHHDGQHGTVCLNIHLCALLTHPHVGLIKYKIVIHCFIDGFSRYILGIRAHNNNRAQTVLDLFLSEVVGKYGPPEKVRGDHGVENLKVAEWMRQKHGAETRPYLWGA